MNDDTDQVEDKELAVKAAKRTLALQALASSEEGRELLNWLLDSTGWGNNPYRANDRDTARACGAYQVGQDLVDEIELAGIDLVTSILKERVNETSNRTTE